MARCLRGFATVLVAFGQVACLVTIDESRIPEDPPPIVPSSCDAFPGPTVDVRSHGAACDGVTDDSAAVQAAIDALKEGAILDVPCVAALGTQLTVDDKIGVAIRGTGGGFTALGGLDQMLHMSGCSDCAVCGLKLDGNAVAGGIRLDACTGTTVEGNIVTRPGPNSGITSELGVGEQFLGNTVQDGTGSFDDAARGIFIRTDGHAVVTENTIRNMTADAFVLYVSGLTATGNLVEGTIGSGMNVHPSPGPNGPWQMEDNTIRSADGGGVLFQLDEGEGPVTMSGLVFSGNTVEDNGAAGVVFQASVGLSDATFSDNRLRNNHDPGNQDVLGQLAIRGGTNITVENNEILGDYQGEKRSDRGIVLDAVSPISAVEIAGNLIDDHTASGVELVSSTGTIEGVTISGNTFERNGFAGVMIQDGNVVDVSLTRNCFFMNGATLVDLRSRGALPAPAEGSGCPR